MKVLSDSAELNGKRCAVAVGKFDGLHKGHIKLLMRLVEVSRARGLESILVTFSPTPAEYFSKSNKCFILTDEERNFLIEQKHVGVNYTLNLMFDKRLAEMSAEEFCRKVLKEQLHCELFAAGSGFVFGKEKRGNMRTLGELGAELGISVMAVDEEILGEKISSENIRGLIAAGNLREAKQFLGYNFYTLGIVERGREIGRTLGFPTLNIIPHEKKILPPRGVYVSRTTIGNRVFDGITNIGVNPTVGGERLVVETNAFGFEGEVYGEKILIEFFNKLREEVKFSGIEELKRQIASDKVRAERFFAEEARGGGAIDDN